MTPSLRKVGHCQAPVVVIDDFSGEIGRVVDLASALAPFPEQLGNYYPGKRRVITAADTQANAYVDRLCEAAAPFIGGAFDVDGFDLLEASFSMVTTPPAALSPAQCAPHFDSTDPSYLALLHFVHVPGPTGTAFYRQRRTGIEMVSEANVASFVRTAEGDAARLAPGSGYIEGDDPFFEQIGAVQAKADRLLIYQGSLLHSGIVPASLGLSDDPRRGRLTANLFVRAH